MCVGERELESESESERLKGKIKGERETERESKRERERERERESKSEREKDRVLAKENGIAQQKPNHLTCMHSSSVPPGAVVLLCYTSSLVLTLS